LEIAKIADIFEVSITFVEETKKEMGI